MSFNADKCFIIVYSRQPLTHDAECWIVEHTPLSVVQETKYQGVPLQTNIEFANYKTSKAKRHLLLDVIKCALSNVLDNANVLAYILILEI